MEELLQKLVKDSNKYGFKWLGDYAFQYEFIVYREVNGEYWFYGAYSNGVKAQAVAHEINGLLLATPWRI